MTKNEIGDETPATAGWRFRLGVVMFLLSLLGPLVFIPLVAASSGSAAMITSVSGSILVGAEVLLVAAVAVMGKPGYSYLKNRIFGLLKLYGPPEQVSRARYIFGLVILAIPILVGWLAPYAGTLIPGYEGNEFSFALVGDIMLLVSLFILGGDFWNKLRALFIHDAKAVFG